jgi:N6-adenosine-specific RNA methylase IME4
VKYRTIVADPPWRYRWTKGITTKGFHPSTAEAQYPTMSLDEIAALDFSSVIDRDAHLYMWVTNPILCEQRAHDGPNPVAIARQWGFEPKTLLTWLKGENGAGMGFFFRGDTEHVLFCVRGNLPIPAAVRRSNVFRGARGGHSEKPNSFLDLVEQVSPGPYLELFARRQRLGWDTWGNEALNHLDAA